MTRRISVYLATGDARREALDLDAPAIDAPGVDAAVSAADAAHGTALSDLPSHAIVQHVYGGWPAWTGHHAGRAPGTYRDGWAATDSTDPRVHEVLANADRAAQAEGAATYAREVAP